MTAEPQTFDIPEIPALAQAVAAARASGGRLRLVERGEEVAELVPVTGRPDVPQGKETPRDMADVLKGLPPNSVTERTAGALSKYRLNPPLSIDEEK